MSNHNIQEAMSHNPAKAQAAMHGLNLAHVLDSKISSRFITPHPNVDKHSPEGQALRNYSASSKEINNALIAGDHRFLNGESSVGFSKSPINYQGVKRVMAKAKPLPRDHHVYSGLGYWTPNEDNGIIHTKAFTSASHNLGTAYDFAHRTIIHFHLPKGYDKAINMKKFSSYHNEDEVLLDHDQHWKIYAVHEYTGTYGQPVKIITVKPHTPETNVNESSFHSTIHFKRDLPRSTKFNSDDKSLYSRSDRMRRRLKDAVNADARQQHTRLVSHFTDIGVDSTPFIHRYTSTTGAAGINRVALEEAGHEITPIHRDRSETINGTYDHAKSVADLHGLDEEMEKHSKPLPEDVHVYSGIGHRDIGDIKEGSVVHTPAYTSSTIYPPTSKDYAGSGPRTILHFHLPEGSQHGAYIAHGSRYDNEREFLLKRNQKWKVQKIVDHRHLDSDKKPNGQFFTQQFNEGAGNGGHRVITLVPHTDNVNEATIHARAVLKPSRFTKWKTDDKYVKAEAIRQRFHDAVDSDVSHQHGRLVNHYGSIDTYGDESKIGPSDKALKEYTSSARSQKLNKHALVLSGAKDAEDVYPNVDPKMVHETAKQILGEFDAHLNEHSHPLPEDMHVYSGTGLWKPGVSKVGDVLHTPAYTSTSLHPRTARTFAFEHIIHFQLPKGSTHGSYIGAKTFHAREKEFLLKRDQKWKVSNIEDMGTYKVLSVVPHNDSNVQEAFGHDPTLPAFKKKQRYASIDDFPQFKSSAEHKHLKSTHVIPDKYKWAVNAYGNGSSDINQALINKDFTKGGNVSKKYSGYIGHDASVHKALIKMFDEHPSALTREHHVYSGLGRKDPTEYMKRGIFTTPAYTSTSVKPSIAIQHTNSSSGGDVFTHSYKKAESIDEHVLHFHLPEGYTGGKYIQGHTAYDEHEMVLRPKQKWRVVGKHTLELGTGTAHYRHKTGPSPWDYYTKKVTVPHRRHIWTVVPHEDNPHMVKQPVSEALEHDPKTHLGRRHTKWNVRPALRQKHSELNTKRVDKHAEDTATEGAKLIDAQESGYHAMGAHHKEALNWYTSDSGAINNHLISSEFTDPGDLKDIENAAADIHDAIKTHGVPLEQDHHVYSGTMHKPFSELRPGETVHMPAFTSSSININVAKTFTGIHSNRTILHFHLPKGYSNGIHVEGISDLPHEQEYLLNKDQKWKVHAVKDYNGGIGEHPNGKMKILKHRVVTLKPHDHDIHEATVHNTIAFRGRRYPHQDTSKHPEYANAINELSNASAYDAINQHSRFREHFDSVPYYSPLSEYTDSSDHATTINKSAVRKSEALPYEHHNIEALSQAIRSHTTGLPEETHTYSGLKWDASKVLEVGKSVHLPAFTSTSLSPHIALNHLESYNTKWAGDAGRTKTSRDYHIIHFHLPEGYKGGVFVGHRSKYPHEHEYLLDKGQKWKVSDHKIYHKHMYEHHRHHVWTLTPDEDHETS